MEVSDWISLSAAIIAGAALWLAVREGKQSRKHNKLSAKPLLSFFRNAHDGELTIILSNEGLGPAIITNFRIELDGVMPDGSFELMASHALGSLRSINPVHPPQDLITGVIPKNHPLGASKKFTVVKLKNIKDDEFDDILKEIKERIEIIVDYNSIYEEPQTVYFKHIPD